MLMSMVLLAHTQHLFISLGMLISNVTAVDPSLFVCLFMICNLLLFDIFYLSIYQHIIIQFSYSIPMLK
jgi:hypothetical protein